MNDQQVAADLRAAADLLEKGWARGMASRWFLDPILGSVEAVCSSEAIIRVTTEPGQRDAWPHNKRSREALFTYAWFLIDIGEETSAVVSSDFEMNFVTSALATIQAWNDRTGRTAYTCKALLRRCADALEEND